MLEVIETDGQITLKCRTVGLIERIVRTIKQDIPDAVVAQETRGEYHMESLGLTDEQRKKYPISSCVIAGLGGKSSLVFEWLVTFLLADWVCVSSSAGTDAVGFVVYRSRLFQLNPNRPI